MENYAPQKDKYSDDWEMDLTKDDKVKMLARLDMLEDIANYVDLLREGYTRTLKMNQVDDDGEIKEKKIEHFPIASISLGEQKDAITVVIDDETCSSKSV
tara:strand:+ start:406 stop:705 length:300 start_codon:yes stop_codon:yes gene_type:complete